MNPDQLAELEEQRRFLLRSITDLDREHQYGDVDGRDYATLRDGYTARAAAVLRAIDTGAAELPPRRQRRRGIVAVWVVGTLLVASLAGSGAELLRGAIKIDPTYADPHCFLAITSARFIDPPDVAVARREAQACLDNDPPSQMIGMIEGFIADLGGPSTTG